jgi:hypothetical protein
VKPKSTFKWSDSKTPSYYEYDYNDFTYFKVIKKDEEFYYLEGGNLKKIDIDNYIKYYGNNAKCVISNILFLNKKMKSVKNKYHLSEIEKLLEKK